ncbi:1-deoxy-D-xylulose-5-phosphate reductoisomerase [Acetonema longum]|uniref:1-deoxy-D-xylulose 5-phosphate reductoisomerase n=1 Tax=Acetonema longum DSM 6540 TaxID=1009370 RepID=F7NL83_9FIRM|nr:1-deoxy-D-xylulose-5-phosphate reductoisomerase [Acetonema longum]EGO63188.1 1-deoxy-D-xylulose 5-phosphate reductoisomerase [Acetonema longum DSM 6540]
MQHISILGSTGSIGTQCLQVINEYPGRFQATVLAAHHNDVLLEEQIRHFSPRLAVLADKAAADRLVRRYRGATSILAGEEGLLEAAVYEPVETVLTSIVGFAGLQPTVAAIKAGKNIALANKETLVAAGGLVMDLAKEYGVSIIPVDSEHSAIFQCLQGGKKEQIFRLLLTASGGPFLGYTLDRLADVTIEACLKHPNWAMGKKITVDSATLVNKGLEVIEAKWLFGVDYSQIEVVVHPQSIVHSMVEFQDGSVIGQMGLPDMKLPIQYALTYPERLPSQQPRLDLTSLTALTFAKPDQKTFSGLALAFEVGRCGGSLPCVFSAANEVAVYAFLDRKIRFLDIVQVIRNTVNSHQTITKPDLADLFAADVWARDFASQVIRDLGPAIKT